MKHKSLKLQALFLLLALSSMPYAYGQQYGWTDLSANIPGDPDFSGVFFVSDDEGWMSVSSGPEIYHTTDGGATFEIQETSLGTATEAIYMMDENEGYTGGGSGFVYRTLDGGTNWNLLGAMSSTLAELDFANSTQGYACGDNGKVFSITPQGVTNLNSGLATHLSGISAPSVDNVWVCGGGVISHYDGSAFEFQSGPVGSYNSIFFINDNEGWVVGTAGLIGHTEDGGENWYQQINSIANSLYSVFFYDENEGWAIGSQGTILKTTNGGDTWLVDEEGSALTTNFLRGVYFTSPTNGYVVGNGKTLLKYGELSGVEEQGGMEAWEHGSLVVWPNPTRGKFQIPNSKHQTNSKTQIQNIEVVDLYGKVIKPNNNRTIEQLNKSAIDFDISNLPPGIYFIRIYIENQMIVKKLIKL